MSVAPERDADVPPGAAGLGADEAQPGVPGLVPLDSDSSSLTNFGFFLGIYSVIEAQKNRQKNQNRINFFINDSSFWSLA